MRLSSLHSKVTKQAGERSLTVSINFPETLVVGGGGGGNSCQCSNYQPKINTPAECTYVQAVEYHTCVPEHPI